MPTLLSTRPLGPGVPGPYGGRTPRQVGAGHAPPAFLGAWCVIALCLLATFGCSKKEEAEPEPIAPVQVAPVTSESIRRIVEADAVLFPRDQASVVPKISAPVEKFYVSRGDHVKQGQLLAVLEHRDLTAAVAVAKGQVDQADANLRSTELALVPDAEVKARTDVQSAQQQMEATQRLLDSRQKLFQDGALPQRQVDEAGVQFAQAKAAYDSAQEHLKVLRSVARGEQIKTAQAQVAGAKGQQQSAEAQVSYSEIRSPINGVVADRPLYAGEVAGAGNPLLTILDISSVVARANVPQNQAASVKPGDSATITQADQAIQVAAKVTVVSPATDAASTTVQVWVQANNPGERLKPGASVHVAIVTETIPDAAVAPVAAILPGEAGGTAVMVVAADSTAHRRKVEIGLREPGKVQILSGVAPGEQVVVVGGIGLEDKAKVRIVKPAEKDE